MTVAIVGVAQHHARGGSLDGGAAFDLRGSGPDGWMVFDPALARRLLAMLVGGAPTLVARDFTPIERGVLALVAASVTEALGLTGLATDINRPPRQDGAPRLVLVCSVEFEGGQGVVEIGLAVPHLTGAPAAIGDAEPLRFEAAIEIARARLRAADILGAGPGDAVAFDVEWTHGAERWRSEGCPVRLRLGRCSAAALIQERALQLVDGFRLGDDGAMVDGDATPPSSVDPTAALAAAPVEVVAELGRVTLSGAEVLGLVPGSAIELGGDALDRVLLRVGGRPFARGEVVNVEGQVGVRILERLGG